MRARHRHFNPGHAGASMALDSRYLSGTSGVGVSAWTNRANTSNNASQSTGSDQPIYETNSLNGLAGVNFDGTTDYLTWTTGIQMYCGLVLFQATGSQTRFASMWGATTDYQHLFGDAGRWNDDTYTKPWWWNGTWRKDGTIFAQGSQNAASATGMVDLNPSIVSVVLSTNSGALVNQIRDRDFISRVIKGNLYQYQIFINIITPANIKRLQHAAAYSFKIACS